MHDLSRGTNAKSSLSLPILNMIAALLGCDSGAEVGLQKTDAGAAAIGGQKWPGMAALSATAAQSSRGPCLFSDVIPCQSRASSSL